ncbi:hypothetical protein BGZ94_002640 [Podila epigama]|nr:hypothetical protein BGZ94_002640 [Podila epigama]
MKGLSQPNELVNSYTNPPYGKTFLLLKEQLVSTLVLAIWDQHWAAHFDYSLFQSTAARNSAEKSIIIRTNQRTNEVAAYDLGCNYFALHHALMSILSR